MWSTRQGVQAVLKGVDTRRQRGGNDKWWSDWLCVERLVVCEATGCVWIDWLWCRGTGLRKKRGVYLLFSAPFQHEYFKRTPGEEHRKSRTRKRSSASLSEE